MYTSIQSFNKHTLTKYIQLFSKFWIRLQIFAFLPSHFLMEVLSLRHPKLDSLYPGTNLLLFLHSLFQRIKTQSTEWEIFAPHDSFSVIPHIHLIINFRRTCLLHFFKLILTHTALDQGDISCLEDSKTSHWHLLPLISPLSPLFHVTTRVSLLKFQSNQLTPKLILHSSYSLIQFTGIVTGSII